jgi:hypothetical protein
MNSTNDRRRFLHGMLTAGALAVPAAAQAQSSGASDSAVSCATTRQPSKAIDERASGR